MSMTLIVVSTLEITASFMVEISTIEARESDRKRKMTDKKIIKKQTRDVGMLTNNFIRYVNSN